MQSLRQRFGHGLRWSRLIWGITFVVALGTFFYALPYYYAMLTMPCTGDECMTMQPSTQISQALATLGLPIQLYAVWYVLLVTMLAAVYWAAASMLIWRRSTESSVWLFSLILLIVGAFVTPAVDPLVQINIFWHYYINIMNSVMWLSIILLFFIFPDGRFVPRWSWLGIFLVICLRTALFLPDSSMLAKVNWPPYLEPIIVIAIFGSCIYAQIYRYRHVSSPVQRQQTKWIVYGLVLMALLLFAVSIGGDLGGATQPLVDVVLEFTLSLVGVLIFMTLPVTVTIAILRYRLWDIDILIRRTLIYSVLTTILAIIYFGSVVGLQTLFRNLTGQGQNTFVTVLSTLAIAALFTPLRRRVQNVIDRRLYRRQYDAEQVLVAFGETVREETDLDRLATEMVQVVQETIQPTQVLLWLRKPSD